MKDATHEKPEEAEPEEAEPEHLSGVNRLVHEAIKDAYSQFGDGKDRNSAGCEHRSTLVKALDFLQIAPYGEYYFAYEAAKGINKAGEHFGTPGKIVSHVLAAPFAAAEVLGLVGNEELSYALLATNHGKANLYEGIQGTIVPHFSWDKAPKIYLPGIHHDGHIDFEW